MRGVTLILVVLLFLLQYPLWLGKGSWLTVWDLHRQVEAQQQANLLAQTRNAVLDAEVRDLKQGTAAIEERARSELGMIKRDEVFFQVLEDPAAQMPVKQAAQIH
jgi:cell division protein FtsB